MKSASLLRRVSGKKNKLMMQQGMKSKRERLTEERKAAMRANKHHARGKVSS
jgi:hypothetical protein